MNIPRFRPANRPKIGLLRVELILLWLKTYLVQRFCFELPVKGWEQELLMLVNPVSSVLVFMGVGMCLFRKHQPAVSLAVSALTSMLLLADLVYFRFYNDFITVPVILHSEQIGEVWGSIYSLLRPDDSFLFFDTFALLFLAMTRKAYRAAERRIHPGPVLAAAVIWFFITLSIAQNVRPELLERTFDRQIVVRSIGAYNYHVYDLLKNSQMNARKANAGSRDLEAAKSFLQQFPKDEPDRALFGIAKGYNVFLVSMESVQAFVIGRSVDGHEITPFLNGLIRDSFYFDHFYHQTGQGKTSDAEFMIDTSLYPLPSGAVFFTHDRNTYGSLPELLKKEGYFPAAFHGNHSSFWNRGNMYRTLGYERFVSSADFAVTDENSVGWGLSDMSFFEQSAEKLKGLPQPFYAKLITLTNHHPFELKKEERLIPDLTTRSKTLNRYIPSVRYTDEALKVFFDRIKAAGLYEHSVFILYGDHYGISQKHNKAMAQLLGKEKITAFDHIQLQKVPLLIHIPGVPGRRMGTVSGQIDLKPTLLHLLGLETEEELNFGHDLFAKNRPESAILRDGSAVTDKVVYTKNRCYDASTGMPTDASGCERIKKDASDRLSFSDSIIYGDLLRFLSRGKKL